MSVVRGVVFDVDGTLVDSNDAHAHAWVDAFRAFGYDVPLERVRELIGMGGDHLIPAAVDVDGRSPHGKALAAQHDTLFQQRYLRTVRPFPGVRPLLERMRRDGLGLYVATSSKHEELQAALRIAGVDDLLNDDASRKSGQRSKPSPDVVQAAVERSGLPPSELVMIGDTPYDLEAAAHAGLRSIAFRCGRWTDDRLHGAVQIYDGPSDMLEHYGHFERLFLHS